MAYSPNIIIPKMTSNTIPQGVASASSYYAPHMAWYAFDHTIGAFNKWLVNSTSGWLQYQFPTAEIVTQYTIQEPGEGLGNRMPKDWIFKGSNNGIDWTPLDTITNETAWGSSEKRTYQFTNSTAYLYYRLDISDNNGDSYLGVGELEMMVTDGLSRKFNTVEVAIGAIRRKFNTVAVSIGAVYRKFAPLNLTQEEQELKEETVGLSESYSAIVSRRRTILSDAEISISTRQRILSNAHIKALGTRKAILSDALITSKQQKTITSDAHIKAEDVKKTILSDAHVSSAPIFRVTITSDANIVGAEGDNLLNKISFVQRFLKVVLNKVHFGKRTTDNINCIVNTVIEFIGNIGNKINLKKQPKYNVLNDIRFLASWQRAGDFGFQSLGKSYIKVFINSIEVTDVDVDSINIHQEVSSAHTASFELGRAYDSTRPAQESIVEIKYHNSLLYTGYISNISPSDSPEHIRIECQDEFWKQNRTNKYFFVGHKPTDNQEKYYNTIKQALYGEFSWSVPFGNFVPETIDLFAIGQSDSISNLMEQSGNYGWFYDVNGNKQLWKPEEGSVIKLERQTIGTNLGLYQVIDHRFNENIEEIINKYRVQMGDKVIRTFNNTGGSRTYTGYNYSNFQTNLLPAWDSSYEKIAAYSSDGYGFNYPEPGKEKEYGEVFKKYYIPRLNAELSSWTDRYPPRIRVESSAVWGFLRYFTFPVSPARSGSSEIGTFIDEGFTIDYENHILTFNEPHYLHTTDAEGTILNVRAPLLKLAIWKKNYYTVTLDPTDNPEEDISNPLMFFTDKMGSYPVTILKDLSLSSLSVQEGITYVDNEGVTQVIPSWNDTEFARDYANWQLSKTCDKKITGDITITLDTACFYNIDLAKRIFINGITDSNMNIVSIDYNISNFTVTIRLENSRAYTRTVSLPTRGE